MSKFRKILQNLRFWKRRKPAVSYETDSASSHQSIASVDVPDDENPEVDQEDEAPESEESQVQQEERDGPVDEPEVGATECLDVSAQFQEPEEESDESLESDESTDLDDDYPPINFAQVREDLIHEPESLSDNVDSNALTFTAFEDMSDDGEYPEGNLGMEDEGIEGPRDNSEDTPDIAPPDFEWESTPEPSEAEESGDESDENMRVTTTSAPLQPMDVPIPPNPREFHSLPSGGSANPSTSLSSTIDYQAEFERFERRLRASLRPYHVRKNCMVCDEIKPWDDLTVRNHWHPTDELICVECMRMYLHTQIVDQGILDIMCPLGPCRVPVLYAQVQEYGSEDDFAL
jgi:hypothetical protein